MSVSILKTNADMSENTFGSVMMNVAHWGSHSAKKKQHQKQFQNNLVELCVSIFYGGWEFMFQKNKKDFFVLLNIGWDNLIAS